MTADRQKDTWRIPALLLWLAFFYLGLFPELSFYYFREAGHVSAHRAMINSPYVLSLSLCGYLGYFTYLRCRELNLDFAESQGKGLQLTLIAFVAFLPIGLDQFGAYSEQFTAEGYRIMVAFAAVKCLAWLYLMSLMLRYYLLQGPMVFMNMPQLFGRPPRHTSATTRRSTIEDAAGGIPDVDDE